MVKLHFRLSDIDIVELEIQEPLPFAEVLKLCNEKVGGDCGGVIAVIRNGRVLSMSDMVGIDEEIVVYPAISGG